MSQGVIIRRPANKTLNGEYLALALASCSKVWGASFVDKGVLECFQGTDPTAETILDTLEQFKDVDVTLYLGNEVAGTNLKTVPPFPLIENDEEQALVAIIPEGNFPGFVKEKSSSSPAYHLAESLFDDFNATFDLVDKDIGKFMAGIQKESFQKKIKLNSVGRGYITVIAQNGESFTFAQGDTAKEIDGVWVSNHFDFGAKAEKAPEPEKKRGMFSRSTVREKVDHQPSNAVNAAGVDQPDKTDTAVKAPVAGEPSPPRKDKEKKIYAVTDIRISKIKIPQHFNRKNKRNWIKERIGYNPQGVDDPKSEYEVYSEPDGTILTRSEINKLFGMSAAGLKALTNPEAAGKAEENDVKDRDVIPVPVISGASRERLKTFVSSERVKKIIAENSTIITDPYNIQGTEAKLPTLAAQLEKKNLAEFDALPFAQLLEIGRGNIHELANIAHAWRLEKLKLQLDLDKLKGKKVSPEEVHQIAKEELVPETKKRGMFSRNAA